MGLSHVSTARYLAVQKDAYKSETSLVLSMDS